MSHVYVQTRYQRKIITRKKKKNRSALTCIIYMKASIGIQCRRKGVWDREMMRMNSFTIIINGLREARHTRLRACVSSPLAFFASTNSNLKWCVLRERLYTHIYAHGEIPRALTWAWHKMLSNVKPYNVLELSLLF